MTAVRTARPEDAGALAEIYRPYVESTAITFEYDPPDEAEFRRRMAKTLTRYPYLVLEEDGRVLGYAYASAYYGRKAYDWCCELSIYLHKDSMGKGYGRALYEALEERLKRMGLVRLYACVAWPEREDEYLTGNSVAFHRHLGFTEMGHLRRCGYKFGRWYDVIWLEKVIGECKAEQPEIIPFPELKE